MNFVLGHTSGTAEQGTDRNGGIIDSRTEGNFMYLKFVNLIICNSGDVFFILILILIIECSKSWVFWL